MSNNMEKSSRNLWPAGLFLTLAAFVLIQLGIVALATTTFEGLDDVQYYRNGVQYGQEIARQRDQRELGWKLAPRWQGDNLMLAVLDADDKPVMRAEVKATVGRPATMREDEEVGLSEVGPGIYQATRPRKPGAWRVRFDLRKGKDIVKAEFRPREED